MLKAAVEEELAIQLPVWTGVAFTATYWTSMRADPYLGMTLHFINKEFQMRKMIVDC